MHTHHSSARNRGDELYSPNFRAATSLMNAKGRVSLVARLQKNKEPHALDQRIRQIWRK
jgi:hypothetical protein